MIVLCVVPFIIGCLFYCLKKGNPLFVKLQAHLDKINGIMQEDVTGMRIIKACVREVYEKIRFGKANGELIRTQLQVLVIFSFMNPVINAMMYLAIAFVLLAGSYQAAAGAVTPGDIMAAITYATRLLNGIMMMVMISQSISRGAASWKRLKEILECEPELQECSGSSEEERQSLSVDCDKYTLEKKISDSENPDSRRKNEVSGTIEFQNVSFSYTGSSRKVLEHINLTIKGGETIGIMGVTGCGKSTLAGLIPRFYDVTEGALLVDGVDVREYRLKDLREKVSIALQKSELFSETAAENIAWGKAEASEEEIREAAGVAQADAFISEMKEGYHSFVAERGTSLSGGQKQRMSIARAVIKNAQILIFDDATSALDLKTEAALYESLQKAKPDCTKIIIAQRIASILRADRIVVLEQGQIAAVGTHEELMNSCKAYQDIYYSQLGEEDEING